MRHSQRLVAAGVAGLTLLTGWTLPVAHATPPSAPQAPAPSGRPVVTPTITSYAADSVVATSSTGTVGSQSTSGATKLLATVTPRTTTSFNLIGATWAAASDGVVVQARTLSGSAWSDWVALSADGSETDNGKKSPGVTTDPIYVGESTGIELRAMGAAGATISGLKATTVSSPTVAADSVAGAVTAAAVSIGVPPPSVISRSAWGADESLRSWNGADCATPNIDSTIKAAVIHHTAGSNDYTAAGSAAIVRGIYAYHVQSNGWCDIGYNFLIDKYGQIFEGRFGGIDLPVHGAHATQWNTNTVGISFMMNSVTMAATEESMNAATALLAWKLGGSYRDPHGSTSIAGLTLPVIFGHGDVMATECPGTNLAARLGELRDRTANTMGGRQTTPLSNLWTSLGGDGSALGPVHRLESPLGAGRYTSFANGGGYQTPAGQAFWMGTGIEVLYKEKGGPTGSLGWPTASQTMTSSGIATVLFEHGSLVFSGADYYTPFVKAIYNDFLHRAPSQSDIDWQAGLLAQGKVSRGFLALLLATSEERLSVVVTNLYVATLGRQPDAAGLAFHIKLVQSGMTVAQLTTSLYASAEYYQRTGGTAQAWVTALYSQMLGRAPEAGAVSYWAQTLSDPSYTRMRLAYDFFQSYESRLKRVGVMYQTFLQRSPEPGAAEPWAAVILGTTDLIVEANLTQTAEYWTKANQRY